MNNENKQETQEIQVMTERLEAALFQFITLYERWSEERYLLEKQSNELKSLIQNFAAELSNLGKLEIMVKGQLRNTIQEVSHHMAKEVGRQISISTEKSIEQTVIRLEKLVSQAEHSLLKTSQQASTRWLKIAIISLISSSMGAFLVMLFFKMMS